MGVSYYKCENCQNCYYEEVIHEVTIEGYTTITLCNFCRDENMDKSPGECIILKGEYEFGDIKGFGNLYEHVIEDGNYTFQFDKYSPKNKEEAEAALVELEKRLIREEWEDFDHYNEDNTIFTPKRAWLEGELVNVNHQIEDYQKKKQKLENLLK